MTNFWKYLGITGAIILVFGIFYYFFWRICSIYHITNNKLTILSTTGIFFILTIGIVIGERMGQDRLSIPSTIVMGVCYLILVLLLPLFIQHLISIRYTIPAQIMSIIFFLMIGGGIYQAYATKITTLEISSPKITSEKNLIFISDIHTNEYNSTRFVQRIIDKIQKLHPDFILIGGDLLNGVNEKYIPYLSPFNQISVPIYATLGNHDSFGDENITMKIFDTTPIIPLRNQSTTQQDINIIGIDDKTFRKEKNLNDITKEVEFPQNDNFNIFITHQPIQLEKLKDLQIDLELAGHTHNGQFFPVSRIVGFFNDYKYGRYDENKKSAFVSQGVGTRGLPFRLGTQSEIVHIKLLPERK